MLSHTFPYQHGISFRHFFFKVEQKDSNIWTKMPQVGMGEAGALRAPPHSPECLPHPGWALRSPSASAAALSALASSQKPGHAGWPPAVHGAKPPSQGSLVCEVQAKAPFQRQPLFRAPGTLCPSWGCCLLCFEKLVFLWVEARFLPCK